MPTLPAVPFLKPTGIDRPDARFLWIWLSVVRAPIAAHVTASEMYCGVIGSRNSLPVGSPSDEHLEQQPARHVEPGVDVARAVEMGIVDHPLPPGGRARLLEVDAHRQAQLVAQLGRQRGEAVRVVDGGLDVVDAARPDDHEQAVVRAAEDVDDLRPAAQDGLLLLARKRQVVQDLGRRLERHDPVDPLVSDPLGMALHQGPYLASHCASRLLSEKSLEILRAYGARNGVRGLFEEYVRQAAAGRTPS